MSHFSFKCAVTGQADKSPCITASEGIEDLLVTPFERFTKRELASAPLQEARVLTGPVVLVVEDEPFIRMVTAEFLSDEGFCVVEAANATEAIAVLESNSSVEVIFTDIDLKDRIDGIELMNEVARRWPGVRLFAASGAVILTPSAMPQGSKFFSKPYDLASIANAFRRSLAA